MSKYGSWIGRKMFFTLGCLQSVLTILTGHLLLVQHEPNVLAAIVVVFMGSATIVVFYSAVRIEPKGDGEAKNRE